MKKLFLVLAVGIAMASCNETDKDTKSNPNDPNEISKNANRPGPSKSLPPADTTKQTIIEWLDGTTVDFGSMKQGDTLTVAFKFKNAGNKPLIISNVNPGCGCTVAKVPKKPYAPGESDVIEAVFDSNRGQVGHNSKNITVHANTNPEVSTLVFNVDVKPKS